MRSVFATSVILTMLATSAWSETPGGVFDGCRFDACTQPTAQCCSLARQQKAACDETNASNAPEYPKYQDGKRVQRAQSECSRCSQAFVSRFCGR